MDLQQLIKDATPGSVWLRTDGSRARVLAITNLSLSANSQQKYVPVVVYVGPSGNVFSRPLKDFASYFPTLLSYDETLEAAMKKIATPLNAAPPARREVVDNEEIDMSEPAPREKPVVQVREKVETKLATVAQTGDYNDLLNRPPAPPEVMRSAFQIGADPSRKIPSVSADQLSRALRVYSQVPDEHLGLVVHKLSFELSPRLTIENLKEVFAPDEWVNTVDMFRIGTPVHDETVGVDAYIGVYPEFTRNVLYGTVYVGVDMVPVVPLQSHVHETVSDQASQTTAPFKQVSEVESPAPEATDEVAGVPVDETPEEVPQAVAGEEDAGASGSTEPVATESVEIENQEATRAPADKPGGVEGSAQKGAEEVRANGSPEIAPESTPVKKPRKKRTPKAKVVMPPADDDTDIDVENLS